MVNKVFDKFDFRNVLIIASKKEDFIARIKKLVEQGYNCYVISDAVENYSNFVAIENIFSPKEAMVLLQFVSKVGEKRYYASQSKRVTDELKTSDKTIIVIENIESIIPYKNEIETSFISLLAKGYAGGICFIIGSKNNLTKTYFMQSIVGLCPNKIYEENLREQLAEIPDTEVDLFFKAVECVIDSGSASISLLKRKFQIGYSRAATLFDMMVHYQIIGEDEFGKIKVLIKDIEDIKKKIK